MKKYRFEYREECVGVIDVYAETEDEARELAESFDGDVQVYKGNPEIGELMEIEDLDVED